MATTTVVEQCRVEPSAGAPTEMLLPLMYYDIVLLPLRPQEHLIFYSFQCSESLFSETIVPNLKKSLSLTLKHFSPLAGNIIFPLTSSGNMPVSHYVSGDSISLTVAVSKADLIPLTGNLSRDADQFHDYVAPLPPATYSTDFIKFSVAAIQVTLLPNQGICIGITHHHAIADGSTILPFVKAWASINKFNWDSNLLASSQKYLPFYDRSNVEGSDTLTPLCWNYVKNQTPMVSSTNSRPTNKTRATFVLSGSQIEKLKNFVASKKPSIARLSSFAVVCAHVWTCVARSAGDDVADNEPEHFHCVADSRRRLTPPLPDNYFGNCLTLVMAELTHERLKRDEGIVVAAEAIGEAIHKTLNNDGGFLEGSMSQFLELERIKRSGNRVLGVAGSPKYDVYDVDFGWGRPKKFELVQIDLSGSVCLCKSREYEGGVEITLSLEKAKMDAFEAMFNQGVTEAAEVTYNQLSKL